MPTEPLLRNTRMQKGEQIYMHQQKPNASTKCSMCFILTMEKICIIGTAAKRNNGEDELSCVFSQMARK